MCVFHYGFLHFAMCIWLRILHFYYVLRGKSVGGYFGFRQPVFWDSVGVHIGHEKKQIGFRLSTTGLWIAWLAEGIWYFLNGFMNCLTVIPFTIVKASHLVKLAKSQASWIIGSNEKTLSMSVHGCFPWTI
jgi:hypothetical protein